MNGENENSLLKQQLNHNLLVFVKDQDLYLFKFKKKNYISIYTYIYYTHFSTKKIYKKINKKIYIKNDIYIHLYIIHITHIFHKLNICRSKTKYEYK